MEEIIKEFPKVLNQGEEIIEYSELGKCSIKTQEGEKVVKKGQCILQALRKRLLEYFDDLKRRKIIGR